MRKSATSTKPEQESSRKASVTGTVTHRFTPQENAPLGAVPRLYQQIYEILARQIRAGERLEGDRLGESSIASQFGVSRAPVRQALAELEQHGLIEKANRRGYRVSMANARQKRRVARICKLDAESLRVVSSPSWERFYAEVESELAARISFGSWRVNEAELARHYDVSRTVTRDIVGRLQQKGVLRKDERSRWYAPALTPEYIGELYELRSVLEPVALVKAAAHVPDGYLAKMRVHLEDAFARAEEIEVATLDRLEKEMHVTLLGFCGNQTLMQAIELPQSLLIAHSFLYKWKPHLFDVEPFLPEHIEIVDNLDSGRTEKAAELLRDHLLVSRERTVERIHSLTGKFSPDNLSYLTLLSPI